MAEIIVRDVDPAVVERLKERARKNGHTLEGEAKVILERSAGDTFDKLSVAVLSESKGGEDKLSMSEFRKLCDEIKSGFKGREFSDSAELIREDRDR